MEKISRSSNNCFFFIVGVLAPFFYPGSGKVEDVGIAGGLGKNVNVPITISGFRAQKLSPRVQGADNFCLI
jgi:acetoin utilization deacetylase AcuC-like enzyme